MPVIKKRKKPVTFHVFPLEIAKLTKHATDAILFRNIAMWQHSASHYDYDDKRNWCWHTVDQFAAEFPYLSRSAIYDSLKRLEKHSKIQLIVDRSGRRNDRHYDRTMWFSLDNNNSSIGRKRYGNISFEIEDAERYGICAAVLLSNLAYQECEFLDREPEADGYRYHQLSASYLSQYFECFTRATINRKVAMLVKEGEIVRHPSKGGWYRLATQDKAFEGVAKANEVASNRDDSASIPDNNRNYKEQRNEASNENTTEAAIASPAAMQSALPVSELSPGLAGLMRLHRLKQSSASKVQPITGEQVNRVHIDETPHDDFTSATPNDDLPYDIDRSEERVTNALEEADRIRFHFEIMNIACNKSEIKKVRQLFYDNPHVDSDHIINLWSDCKVLQNHSWDRGLSFLKVITGDNIEDETERYDPLLIPKKVKTAAYFLKMLPEIIEQTGIGDIAPYSTIDFTYNKRPKRNGIVQQSIC